MKKIIAVVIILVMSLTIMAQAEAVNIGLENDVLKKDVTGKTQELAKLDSEVMAKLDMKIVIMPRVRNYVTTGQARFQSNQDVAEEQNLFQNAIDFVTFWN